MRFLNRIMIAMFCGWLISGVLLVGCGSDDDNQNQNPDRERSANCDPYLQQYYGAVTQVNDWDWRCLAMSPADVDGQDLCVAIGALFFRTTRGLSYDSVAAGCSCGDLWPDYDHMADECKETCSGIPHPCFERCFTESLHEQNDTFWECSGNSVCMEKCETKYSLRSSTCNDNNRLCALSRLVENGYCHRECLDES